MSNPVRLPDVVRRLKRWRVTNQLSQRAAAHAMKIRGCEIPINTIQEWEQGRKKPGRSSTWMLNAFLSQHPVVNDPLVFRHGPRFLE